MGEERGIEKYERGHDAKVNIRALLWLGMVWGLFFNCFGFDFTQGTFFFNLICKKSMWASWKEKRMATRHEISLAP
jgi:hypothetical protein